MIGQIDGKIKEERSKKLMNLSDKNQKEYNETYLEKEVEILCEEQKNGYYRGHTKNYILALVKSTKKLENKIVKARCIKAYTDSIETKIQDDVTKS